MILILLLTTAYSQTLTFSFARIQLMLCYRVEGYVTRNVVIIFRSTHYCTVYYHAFISSYIYIYIYIYMPNFHVGGNIM